MKPVTSRDLLDFAAERFPAPRRDEDGDIEVIDSIPEAALAALFHEVAILACAELQVLENEKIRAERTLPDFPLSEAN